MPIVTRRIADEEAPQALGLLNFIFCRKTDKRQAAFSAFEMALRTDRPWSASIRAWESWQPGCLCDLRLGA
jgi:hypothetical protein